ncbi:hypothetical protein [Brumimicrobium mesophilum]|uniref:hypothetical protein n=1 Tax=Brumimicrobium mesophilum TaxID=392717 RepID=UPI001F38399D|nr:hypothetical protein [Brumimicrobium mesophilum]
MYTLILATTFFNSTRINAQNKKEELSFEFGYGKHDYSMGNINQFFVDSFASQTNPILLDKNIEKGEQFSLSLNYRPFKYFDVGLFSMYQFSKQNSSSTFLETDDFGNAIAKHERNYELKTMAISFGLNSTLFISSLLNFEQKETDFLKNLSLGIGVSGGIGLSRVVSDLRMKSFPTSSSYSFFESTAFQGQTFIDVGYYFLNNNLFSSVGVKLGYQYFVTKTVQDRLDNGWIVQGENPINLDFSGLYVGTYLMIGK